MFAGRWQGEMLRYLETSSYNSSTVVVNEYYYNVNCTVAAFDESAEGK